MGDFLKSAAALVLCGVLALFLAGCGSKPATRETLTLRAADGAALAADVYLPEAPSPPALILAHRFGGDRSVWGGFPEFMRRAGYMVIVPDLRGHGGSATAPFGSPEAAAKGPGGWTAALADLNAARKALLEKGASPDNLAVAGEELGAALALLYARREPSMQAVILLSPGMNQHGLDSESAIRELDDCPVLLAVAQNDAYADTSAAALKAAAPAFAELQRYSGAAHGADLFAAHPDAMGQVLEWLRPIIGKDGPKPGKGD